MKKIAAAVVLFVLIGLSRTVEAGLLGENPRWEAGIAVETYCPDFSKLAEQTDLLNQIYAFSGVSFPHVSNFPEISLNMDMTSSGSPWKYGLELVFWQGMNYSNSLERPVYDPEDHTFLWTVLEKGSLKVSSTSIWPTVAYKFIRSKIDCFVAGGLGLCMLNIDGEAWQTINSYSPSDYREEFESDGFSIGCVIKAGASYEMVRHLNIGLRVKYQAVSGGRCLQISRNCLDVEGRYYDVTNELGINLSGLGVGLTASYGF